MTIDELLESEQIKRLKYRYMRALDTHDWELMESLFMPDATTWFGNGKYASEGWPAIRDFYQALVNDNFVSSHIAIHPEITLTGPGTATAVWRFEDTVHYLAANPLAKLDGLMGGDEIQGAGYYYDDYIKVGGDWKIKATGYVRIYERIEHRGQRELDVGVDKLRGRRQRS